MHMPFLINNFHLKWNILTAELILKREESEEGDNINKLIAEKRLMDFSGKGSLTDWCYKNQVVGALGIEELLPEMEI